MILKWNQFIREFIGNSDSIVDMKMQEIKDLVDSISNGQNMVYEWENKSDHQLNVSFSTDDLSIKYEFDIDDMHVTKTAGEVLDFECNVDSIDEGLDIIEKDIQSILGISEEIRFTKPDRRSEELSSNLSVSNFIQRFHKIRNQKLRDISLEHKPTWSNVQVFFSDVEGDRDYWLTHLNIPKEKHKSGLICAKWNDVTCFFKPELKSNVVVYTYESHNLTNFNPPMTREGKSLVQDFIYLCKSTKFVLDKVEVPTRFNLMENYNGQWPSSLKWQVVSEIMDKVKRISELSEKEGLYESEDLISLLEKELSPYDKEVSEFVIDSLLFCNYSDNYMIEDKIEEIIRLGDRIMDKFGTEPMQVLNAYDCSFRIIGRYYDIEEDEEISEARKSRPKAQMYKGKKIPGKYLTKNPGKMKKEIDTYRGKKEYKKDWDADYTSGKGGKGKRVKTKKSAATLAYEKKFKNKEK